MADFDSTFDFTNILAGLNTYLVGVQSSLDDVNAQIAVLESVVGYQDVISSDLATLNSGKSRFEDEIASINAVITEVNIITGLSAEIKAQLYYFYTVLGVQVKEYMARMPFNWQTALSDPDIVALVADTTNPSPAKVAVAKFLYQRYPIYGGHIRILVKFYSF